MFGKKCERPPNKPCTNCQAFGHAATNCRNTRICCLCGGNHTEISHILTCEQCNTKAEQLNLHLDEDSIRKGAIPTCTHDLKCVNCARASGLLEWQVLLTMATSNAQYSPSNTTMRPIIVTLGKIRLSIPVSTATDEWISAEVLRDEFIHQQSLTDAVDNTVELENEAEAEATTELTARFLVFVTEKIHQDSESIVARTSLLLNVFKHLTSTFLAKKDVHSLAAGFDVEVHKVVLTAFCRALAYLCERRVDGIPTRVCCSIALNGSVPSSITLYGAARFCGVHKPDFKAVEILFNDKTNVIDLTMFEDRLDVSVPLHLQFLYKSSMGSAPIHAASKTFTGSCGMYGDKESLPNLNVFELSYLCYSLPW
ncbi:fatty acid synthase alpha subunit Lsd1 [Stygiomarasmius scandens]|uniref:Fatty acid synthase alpha subunit Lsd1 n=1 Tax=Marasmiellus scandens TaxID=2682957 RepID=A0ABR1JIF8_9AGAR